MHKLSALIFAIGVAGAVPATATPAAATTAPSTPAPAAPSAKAENIDPGALAIARQVLAIGMPAEKRSQMLASMMDSLNEQVRKSTENLHLTNDKDLQAVLERSNQRMWDELKPIMSAALPDIFEGMAHAYARGFSADDLNALLAFVKTPAGQHFFERAPMILKDPDVQAANQRMLVKLTDKLPEIMRQRKKDIDDYVANKERAKKAAAPVPVS